MENLDKSAPAPSPITAVVPENAADNDPAPWE